MKVLSRSALYTAIFALGLTAALGMGQAPPAAHGEHAGPQAEPAPLPQVSAELEKIRQALERYRDPYKAVHDGYFSTLACMEFPQGGHEGQAPYAPGGMGVHFFNPQLIGPELDPLKPQVLLYEPVDGKLRLVGAEWLIPTALAKEAPVMFGQRFDGPMEGHYPLMPLELHHWDLHVWLWRENPAGLFSPTNPNIKCTGPYSIAGAAPRLVTVEAPPAKK